MELTLESIRTASAITQRCSGHDSGELLTPVRWDDGLIAWQHTSRGKLVGFTTAEGSLAVFDKIGEFEVVAATDEHAEILRAWAAPHHAGRELIVIPRPAPITTVADCEREQQAAASLAAADPYRAIRRAEGAAADIRRCAWQAGARDRALRIASELESFALDLSRRTPRDVLDAGQAREYEEMQGGR